MCFVITEALGTTPFGGIATATTHAALVLSREGYDVELLHCGHDPLLQRAWGDRYEAGGVAFRWLDRARPVGPDVVADSYRVYEQLRRDPPDVVVFQDWQGLGFCSVEAKRAGDFAGTRLVHIVHGPGDWLREANRRQQVDVRDAASAWMERRSAELADTVVGPSGYLLGWMADHGWQLPADVRVIPYFTAGDVESFDRPAPTPRVSHALTELVFFGRLEERKGVTVFAEALNRLGADGLDGVGVTFLGRAAPMTTEDVAALLAADVQASVPVRFETGLDQAGARAYLEQPGRVAVIPSLLDNSPNVIYECIEDGIPFLASDTGGNPELIHPDDRDATLFTPEPGALADTLARLIAARAGPPPARPAFHGRTSLAAWRQVLDPSPSRRTPPATDADAAVAIVIAHHDQGEHLPDAVGSAAAQGHADIEIVVVDDGSTDPASIAALDKVAAQDWGRPLRVVRQENRYLGAARNAGVAATTAPYVAFCDDDDMLDERFVATLLEVAVRTGAAAVSCSLLNRDADRWEGTDAGLDPVWVFLDAAVDIGTVWNTFGGAGMLVRRDALEAIGGFHEHRGIGHEDWDLLARLALEDQTVVSVPQPLYRYRIRPGSMIRTTSQYANAGVVNAAYASHLPRPLARWSALVRGQHLLLEERQRELEFLHTEVGRLTVELERRTRYLELLARGREHPA